MTLSAVRRISALGILLLFFSKMATAQDANCGAVASAMAIASEIRQLSILRPVPCQLRSRAEVEQYLRDTLKEKVPPEKIHNEEKLFKLLGLIPQDYDYVAGLLRLYTDQVGGYYDADRDYYAMASWIPMAMQMTIAVHELTHALQDQHYDLAKFNDTVHETTDQALARSAVEEGDATAVMVDYSRQIAGGKPLTKEESVSSMVSQNLGGAMLSSTLRGAPAALQAMLIFPYISGLHFVHSIIHEANGYQGLDRVMKKPPNSTREILHPDDYGKPKTEVHIERTAEEERNRGVISYRDTLGEFVISTLLSVWVGPQEASRVADGWAGDEIGLSVLPRAEVLEWDIRWENETEAQEATTAFRQMEKKRFGDVPQSPFQFELQSGDYMTKIFIRREIPE